VHLVKEKYSRLDNTEIQNRNDVIIAGVVSFAMVIFCSKAKKASLQAGCAEGAKLGGSGISGHHCHVTRSLSKTIVQEKCLEGTVNTGLKRVIAQ
jgi:hypothetical protein